MAITLAQGEDRVIQVPFIDDAGTPIDLSTAVDAVVLLQVNNKTQAKYSIVAKTGYGEASINSTNNHIIDIVVKRDQSKNFSTGILKLVCVANIPDTVLGVKAIERVVAAGEVVQGFAKGEELEIT